VTLSSDWITTKFFVHTAIHLERRGNPQNIYCGYSIDDVFMERCSGVVENCELTPLKTHLTSPLHGILIFYFCPYYTGTYTAATRHNVSGGLILHAWYRCVQRNLAIAYEYTDSLHSIGCTGV
jgi:hypothetical protein